MTEDKIISYNELYELRNNPAFSVVDDSFSFLVKCFHCNKRTRRDVYWEKRLFVCDFCNKSLDDGHRLVGVMRGVAFYWNGYKPTIDDNATFVDVPVNRKENEDSEIRDRVVDILYLCLSWLIERIPIRDENIS